MRDAERFGLSPQTIEKICSVLKGHPEIESAIIYGSRAKGTFKPGSDIDLTLVGSSLTTTELLRIENELDDLLLPYTIDLSIKEQIESPDLLDHIHRVGQIFYSNQRPTSDA